ncbi:TPA: DUF905 family protein [Klebsiella pneumoniae]
MTYDDITAKINAFTLKDGVKVRYNFDQYGSTQVEFRDDSGALIWRGWSFEKDFAYYLDRELDRYGVSKSAEEIAEQAAAARASRLRNDAIFCQDNGHDALIYSEFTREEIDAEIAAMNRDLAALQSYCIADNRRPSHVHRADYATDAEYSAAKVAFYTHILRSLWTVRGNSVYRRQVKKTIKSLRDWKAVARKDADAAGVAAVFGDALMVKPVRITTAGGMTLIASQADIKIYPALMRLTALWDMRHGLTRDTHYNHSLPFHCVEVIEYAQ